VIGELLVALVRWNREEVMRRIRSGRVFWHFPSASSGQCDCRDHEAVRLMDAVLFEHRWSMLRA